MTRKEKYIEYIVQDMLKNSHYHEMNPAHIVMLYGTAMNKYNPYKHQIIEELRKRFGMRESEYMDVMRRYLYLLPDKYD